MFNLKELKKYQQAAKPQQAKENAPLVTDSVNQTQNKGQQALVLDAQTVDNQIAVFQEQQIATEAMSLFDGWLNTDDSDLDDGEGLGDRLFSLVVSLADDNKDGEISDEEAEVINVGVNAIADYLISKGVSEENAIDLLSDFDNDLANNVREMVLGTIPDGDDEFYSEMDKVIFSQDENADVLDSAHLDSEAKKEDLTLDAVYKKRFAIRNGKKKLIKKRISGVVRLSAKQKQAIRKMQRKAQTGMAKLRRMKSFRLAKRLFKR